MARPLLKIQRYFRRKPVRFFSFILLYLTAGSLVFLHSGFSGDSSSTGGHGPLALVEGVTSTSAEGLGMVRRSFRDPQTARRFGLTWTKARSTKEPEESKGFATQRLHNQDVLEAYQIKTLSGPTQSPDLDPIENLWNMIKRKMDDHNSSNKAELFECLCQKWQQVTQQQCKRLMKSRLTCLKSVFERLKHERLKQ